MAEYKKSLLKYEDVKKNNLNIKNILIKYIREISKVVFKNKDILVEKDSVKIITNSVYRFELLHHKKEIEKELLKHNVSLK